jgi:hypothetical protein
MSYEGMDKEGQCGSEEAEFFQEEARRIPSGFFAVTGVAKLPAGNQARE